MTKVFFIFMCLILSFTPFAQANQDQIIAAVNNEAITQSDFNEFLRVMYVDLRAQYSDDQLEENKAEIIGGALENLIKDKLILQEAKKQKLEVKESDVKEKFEEVKSRFPSAAEFEEDLAKEGLTPGILKERLRDRILMQEIVDKEVRSKINVSPSEVTAYYNGHSKDFSVAQSRKVDSIFVKTEGKADEVLKLIKAGKDFGELMKNFSEAQNIEVVSRGVLLKNIEDAIFSLEVGGTTGILKTNEGFYIFKLIEEIPGRAKELKEVQDEIFNQLREEKFRLLLNEWLDNLKKNAYIYIKK
ncbi:MAG: peptidyl-prolyl cis-trans isomerase [Candidatus Omnitrophota bacterium]